MQILLIALFSLLTIIIYFFVQILIMQMIFNIKDRRRKVKTEKYRELIYDYAYDDKSVDEDIFEQEVGRFHVSNFFNRKYIDLGEGKSKKRIKFKLEDEFLEAAVENISGFTGEYRRKVINLCEHVGIMDYLYNKYRVEKNQYLKEYYLYFLGEIRSFKFFGMLLAEDESKMQENGLLISYFFALLTTSDEYIYDLKRDEIKKYMAKIIKVIELIEEKEGWNLERLMDFFLTRSVNFINFLSQTPELKRLFYYRILNSKTSYQTKGFVFYILALKQDPDLYSIIKDEFYRVDAKSTVTRDEREYLIKLIKAAGELQIDETYELLIKGIRHVDWILRSVAAKYLYDFDQAADDLFSLLFDRNWWVRQNAAYSLAKMGENGRAYLLNALTSEDKFAREAAAYALADSDYMNFIMEAVKNDGWEIVKKELELIVNSGKSTKTLDKVLRGQDVTEDVKIQMLGIIDKEILRKYYDEVTKNYKLDEDVGEKLEEILGIERDKNGIELNS